MAAAVKYFLSPLVDPLAPLEKPECSKVVYFVRHGQGQHNVAFLEKGKDVEEYKNWAWHDSRLTAVGEDQAKALRSHEHMWEHVELVFCSPLSRAIKTSLLARPVDAKLPTICTELVRERIGTHPCDKRRSISELSADFPEVDFSALQPEEEDPFWTPAREPWEDMVTRAMSLLDVIRSRPERGMAVFTHCDFLMALYQNSPVDVTDPTLRSKEFHTGEAHGLVISWADAATVSAQEELAMD